MDNQVYLKIENLNKSFGGVKAVKNISIDVEQNRITSLIGPNGAGKTTLFNLVTRVIKEDAGTIKFKDKILNNYESHHMPELKISRTYQNVVLFDNMSLLENVMLGAHITTHKNLLKYFFSFSLSRKEDEKLKIKAVELLEFVGLKNKINSRISELSFGHQRLAEIARALMCDPEFLMLDEPAAGLNPKETEDLGIFLKKISEKKITVFLVEHDMNLVMNISDKIVVMNFGSFLAEGTPKQISNNKEVISAYLGES